MPRLDPYEDFELDQIVSEYSDPKVWGHMERGDMVRDINRLVVTAKECRQDVSSYVQSYRIQSDETARLRRAISQIRRTMQYMDVTELSTATRNALLESLLVDDVSF